MSIKKWISRQEENELPNFGSHDEARKYFKEKYGDMFQLLRSEMIDGEKIYFYNYIVDYDAFRKGNEELRDKGFIAGMEFAESAQPIEIWEDGRIHIIH